jgi:hypothetical protein
MNTTYFMNLIMGNVFRSKTTPSIPTNYYIGLSKTAPTLSGTNVTEPSDSAYARVNITSSLSVPTNGVITNSSNITFGESLVDWGVITHYCIFDNSTGGNLLVYGQFSSSRTIEVNTVATVKSGELAIEIENPQ